jgi:hypothetical protein
MPRPQFSLKTLLWLMAVVAAFLGGAEFGRLREAGRLAKDKERVAAQEAKVHYWLSKHGIERVGPDPGAQE